MSFSVRDGKFDVVVAAGPRLSEWPTVGARAISTLCANMGLSVGLLGGDTIRARGVLALPGTGGIVFAEDTQGRIHRLHGRAVVRVAACAELPEPFPGWQSRGLVPLSTALRLRENSRIRWEPAIAILGTGNRALRLGSTLLEEGTKEVFCIEPRAQWGLKRIAGWEVERRRFEATGGRIIEGRPTRLLPRDGRLWELYVERATETQILHVVRVVSAGPFLDVPGIREYPPSSLLFELDQTAGVAPSEDIEGWLMEEERGRWLGGRIARALSDGLVGSAGEELDRVYKRARARLKRYRRHQMEPFVPSYTGKFIAAVDGRRIREFEGVPTQAQRIRTIASIECVEAIPCNLCEKACPKSAIDIQRLKGKFLNEADCVACGACLVACPSATPVLIQEREDRSTSTLVVPWRGRHVWKQGELATLVNRRGETLGSGRVLGLLSPPSEFENKGVALVQLEVATHLLWEARGLRPPKGPLVDDDSVFADLSEKGVEEMIEITFNGGKRLVRDRVPVTTALFEIGRSRPGDQLFCRDGSCGLCGVTVDGVQKLACQTQVRRGMAIVAGDESPASNALCSCLDVTREQVLDRLRQGKIRSPEALLSVTHVGEGSCRGQRCMESFRRMVIESAENGADLGQWIDWRFPWTNWVLARSSPGAD